MSFETELWYIRHHHTAKGYIVLIFSTVLYLQIFLVRNNYFFMNYLNYFYTKKKMW
jgi:hypothetical protein